ncbi:divergent polysaccharide deacetylase family protein [Ruegeria sp. WL0004]|uniref:Divergent polysaccharide deacetylase family protein n=1 Tax=Ruegeria marisflavi TaxID=2984152 RepID=A0ABT2WMB1_9RHOB|nr:polysaccharide deacteylase family 2 protein [Ruegeria sp. WL0004]MCU9837036.1 divergent polysaccharide deacetylase family protein [Ruegeria sp. WL0004]
MGGYFGGILTGAILVLIAGAWLSLATPLPKRPDVASDAPSAQSGAAQSETGIIAAPGRDADLVELAPRQPDAKDGGETLTALSGTDTQPPEKPVVGAVSDAITEPVEAAGADVSVDGVEPVAPAPMAEAPLAPQDSTEPTINTAAPEQPSLSTTSVPDQAVAPAVSEPLLEVVASTDAQPSKDEVTATTVPDRDSDPTPDTKAAEEPKPEEEKTSRIAVLPQIGSESEASVPHVGTPVIPLTERDKAETATGALEARPIDLFAAEFENPDDKPLLSIVLIDDANGLGGEALREFPYPLSYALDPNDPDAAEKMARYRSAGAEVLIIADLAATSTAQDAEVSMSVWLGKLPETVGILEGTDTGIQGNRALSDQVTAIAAGTGRGLLTQDNGLNTVYKLAARDGIPAAVVFRDFDGAGQSPTVMRRFLDQAAFRAGQEGSVVMLGRVRPDTISALLLWGLQDRAGRVALAPISAVMKRRAQ